MHACNYTCRIEHLQSGPYKTHMRIWCKNKLTGATSGVSKRSVKFSHFSELLNSQIVVTLEVILLATWWRCYVLSMKWHIPENSKTITFLRKESSLCLVIDWFQILLDRLEPDLTLPIFSCKVIKKNNVFKHLCVDLENPKQNITVQMKSNYTAKLKNILNLLKWVKLRRDALGSHFRHFL